MIFLTEEDVRTKLWSLYLTSGLLMSEWARAKGIDKGNLSKMLNGERPPNDKVLKILALKRQTIYVSEG